MIEPGKSALITVYFTNSRDLQIDDTLSFGASASNAIEIKRVDQSQVFSNVSSAEIQRAALPAGKDLLVLFDSKKNKKIGTISLLKQ